VIVKNIYIIEDIGTIGDIKRMYCPFGHSSALRRRV